LFSLQEADLKIKNFEQTLSIETDKLISAKKDIYSQLYDYNLNMSNKFDAINENILDKFESLEKNFKNFKLALIDENEKFSQYLMEQHDHSQNNIRKLIEFNNEEVKLLTEKVRRPSQSRQQI
jgi:spore germination cell wall hydrolase CwlJ-like protein